MATAGNVLADAKAELDKANKSFPSQKALQPAAKPSYKQAQAARKPDVHTPTTADELKAKADNINKYMAANP